MDDNIKRKNITLIIAVIFGSVLIAGGTYAYLTFSANVTNETYNISTHCFTVDYNINNVSGGQDITGTLFSSGTANKGLNGRVGMKINGSCEINGLGEIKLHVNSTTSSTLVSSAASYCENRSTLEPISGITTKTACEADNVKGRWRGYGDNYCENPLTLERMTDYTTQSDCTNNGGTWTSGGSPLKYAVYDNEGGIGTPVSVGKITSSNIGNDIIIYDNFVVGHNQKYYYIYIWLDGYLTDNTYTNLPFSGYVTSNAIQDNDLSEYGFVDYIESTGTQYIDTGVYMSVDKSLDLKFKYNEIPNTNSAAIIGAYDGTINANVLATWNGKIGTFTNGAFYYDVDDTNEHILNWNFVDGKSYLDNSVSIAAKPKGTCNYSWYLFAAKYNNVQNYSKSRIYYMRIYDNNVLIKSFLPCYRKSDNVVGMYDTVNGEFYTNQASSGSDFTYG